MEHGHTNNRGGDLHTVGYCRQADVYRGFPPLQAAWDLMLGVKTARW